MKLSESDITRGRLNGDTCGGKHSQMQSGECIAETFPGPEGQRDRRVRPQEFIAKCSVSFEHIYCVIDLLVGYWLSQ